ncbi:hypothetical protein CYMTET_35019, partial [Cymbomonas tetramitiformis]
KTCEAGKLRTTNIFAPYEPPGSVRLTSGDSSEQVSILLLKQKEAPTQGTAYQKLAVLCDDTSAAAAQVKAQDGAVDFVGAVPGIGTKVAATRDLSGYGVVYVDYADFEAEQ